MKRLWRWAASVALAGAGMAVALAEEPLVSEPDVVRVIAEHPEPPPLPPRLHDSEVSVRDAVNSAMREAERAVQEAARAGRRFAAGLRGGGSPNVLVMSGGPEDAAAVDALSEDLAVMSRILREKALGGGETKGPWGLGVPFGDRGPEAMYLEGFGALFLLNVDFPLVQPEEGVRTKSASVEDETWERARQDLRGVRESRVELELRDLFGEDGVEYRAARVQELRTALTEALRHARNIQRLKDGDTIAVAVFGPAPRGGGQTVEVRRKLGPDREVIQEDVVGPADGRPARQRSVMMLRVSRGDVVSYAAGKLDAAGFAQRVQVTVR